MKNLESTGEKRQNRIDDLIMQNEDLLDENKINEKLKEFKKKIKTKYEIVSVYSNKDLQKIKKLLIKYAN